MAILAFPPLSETHESGLLAIGGDLEVPSLLLAYRSGIFPWPIVEEKLLCWFAPPERAVLFFDRLHLPRSLKKLRKKSSWRLKVNSDFPAVIRACASSLKRRSQDGTWITPAIRDAYITLHQAGYAHSVECYDDDMLIGGLYGVAIGGSFAGESMFHHKANASKLCLCHLIDHLRAHGATWIDCQQMTPLLSSFGATLVPREEFMQMLKEAIKQPICLFPEAVIKMA